MKRLDLERRIRRIILEQQQSQPAQGAKPLDVQTSKNLVAMFYAMLMGTPQESAALEVLNKLLPQDKDFIINTGKTIKQQGSQATTQTTTQKPAAQSGSMMGNQAQGQGQVRR